MASSCESSSDGTGPDIFFLYAKFFKLSLQLAAIIILGCSSWTVNTTTFLSVIWLLFNSAWDFLQIVYFIKNKLWIPHLGQDPEFRTVSSRLQIKQTKFINVLAVCLSFILILGAGF